MFINIIEIRRNNRLSARPSNSTFRRSSERSITGCNARCGTVTHRASIITDDTRKIFVDESNSARVLVGCKPINTINTINNNFVVKD